MYLRFIKSAMKTRPSKFQGLFYSILALLVFQPLVPESFLREGVVTLTLSVILVASIYAISDDKAKYVIASIVLLIPSLAFTFIHYFSHGENSLTISYISKIAFLFYVTYVSLLHVLKAERVSDDSIYGAVCVYLLMGLSWAHLYALIEQLNPGSFNGLAIDYSRSDLTTNVLRDFIYFSYGTLSTLGFGDIIPTSMASRSFAFLEALSGQIYLTVLVARIMGMYIKQK